jgi:Holliday junction resolvase RusA-like endonuclease
VEYLTVFHNGPKAVADLTPFTTLNSIGVSQPLVKRSFTITIPGEPIAQGRPRFSTHGKFARAYDPKKSREGKDAIKYFVSTKMDEDLLEPLEGALHMRVQFGIMLPKSQERKRTPVPRKWRTKKPDLDNLVKLVKDACSGIVYLDDNQIVKLSAEKIQCAQGEKPFTRIQFVQLDDL